MPEILTVENLNIYDKDKYILKDLNLSIRESSIHALVGGSGSGKSTFCFSVLNLLHKSLSQIFHSYIIFSTPYSSLNWKNIRGKSIFYLPQNPAESFHPYIKIGKQIEDSLNVAGISISKAEICKLLEKFDIYNPESTLQKFPGELSGGERQRVLIAISSRIQPKLLIADEPTTALDPINEKLVLMDLLKLRAEFGTTVLLVTHDRRIVRELADQVTVLKNGVRIESFTLEKNSFPELKDDYTKKLLLERAN